MIQFDSELSGQLLLPFPGRSCPPIQVLNLRMELVQLPPSFSVLLSQLVEPVAEINIVLLQRSEPVGNRDPRYFVGGPSRRLSNKIQY